MQEKIILASQSPRRSQLLEWAGIPFEVIGRPTEESYREGLDKTEIAIHIARQKGLAVQRENDFSSRIILSADTIGVLDARIIGKPRSRDEAVEILADLQGNRHEVVTGVVIRQGAKEWAFADVTGVVFHPLTHAQLEFYVDKYQPYDKAGAYAIQEWIGVVGIKEIQGDFYNVMGLPVSRVVQQLSLL